MKTNSNFKIKLNDFQRMEIKKNENNLRNIKNNYYEKIQYTMDKIYLEPLARM